MPLSLLNGQNGLDRLIQLISLRSVMSSHLCNVFSRFSVASHSEADIGNNLEINLLRSDAIIPSTFWFVSVLYITVLYVRY